MLCLYWAHSFFFCIARHPNFGTIQIQYNVFISLFLTLWETLYNFFQLGWWSLDCVWKLCRNHISNLLFSKKFLILILTILNSIRSISVKVHFFFNKMEQKLCEIFKVRPKSKTYFVRYDYFQTTVTGLVPFYFLQADLDGNALIPESRLRQVAAPCHPSQSRDRKSTPVPFYQDNMALEWKSRKQEWQFQMFFPFNLAYVNYITNQYYSATEKSWGTLPLRLGPPDNEPPPLFIT